MIANFLSYLIIMGFLGRNLIKFLKLIKIIILEKPINKDDQISRLSK